MRRDEQARRERRRAVGLANRCTMIGRFIAGRNQNDQRAADWAQSMQGT